MFLAQNRIGVEADVEINKPGGNWSNIYGLCQNYSIPLIGKICHVTMDWNENFTLSDWTQAVQTAVTNYGEVVKVWEIWNEPINNTMGYFDGNALRYNEMLRAAYVTIKASSPDSMVIGFGGLHLFSGGDVCASLGLDFARNVTAQGGMDYFDAVGLHAYPWGKTVFTDVKDFFNNTLAEYRNITRQKPVWITEIGQHSNTFDINASDQKDFLEQTFTFFNDQNASAYVWYELNDNGRFENDNYTTFGLYDNSSNPKPALDSFIALTNALNQTPSPTPTSTPTPTSSPTQTTAPTKTPSPTPKPSATPTPAPTATPTAEPTAQPTATPSAQPDMSVANSEVCIVIGVSVTAIALICFFVLRNQRLRS